MQEGSDILCTIRGPKAAEADSADGLTAIQVSYDAFVDDIQVNSLYQCRIVKLSELSTFSLSSKLHMVKYVEDSPDFAQKA